jgi:SynChlorMet cassette radical SAM/SPASM protein ScmE
MPGAPAVMRTPRTADIDVTSRCNLRCRYCYFFDNPAVPYNDLPAEEWLRFFDELGRCAVMDVTLAGGEPFIRPDLPELLEGIARNHMRFSILSNGTLVDDGIAAAIVRSGHCNHVQVSLDGSCPETHDACRGKGAFDLAVRGLCTLRKHGVPVAVRVTIHRHNVGDLEATARLLLEELGLRSFGTNSAGYLGSCRVHADDTLLTVEERMAAMETLERLGERYPGRIQAAAGPLADARMWRRMEEARAQGAPAFPKGGRLTACGCYRAKIAVRADGIIVPCNMLTHIELGRINHDSLAEVWQRHPVLNELRMRHTIPLTEFEFCTGCAYIPYCTGNCPALAYTLTGKVNHPSPDGCLRQFLADGGKMGDETLGGRMPSRMTPSC